MAEEKMLLEQMVGKLVLIRSNMGEGSGAGIEKGNYLGVVKGYDGRFLYLEYDVKSFAENKTVISKATVMLNTSYIISVEEIKDAQEK